jgi:predicted ester cyclase
VTENKLVVRGFIEQVLNGKDLAAMSRYVDPDAIERMNGAISMYAVLAAFPDFRLSIELMISNGDHVGVLTTFSGSHQARFMGMEPTGAGVSSRAAFCFRVADGRIVETWAEFEPWGLLPQVGVDPFAFLPNPTFA